MSQSHLAHRLTEYAAQTKPSQQLQVAMDIFNLYHVEGIHLSNKDALAKIAVDNGLFDSTERAVTWLNGNGGNVEVKKMYGVAQKCGITAVPFFVFNDKYAASGAMGVEEFVNVSADISSARSALVMAAGSRCIVARKVCCMLEMAGPVCAVAVAVR